MNLTIAEKDAFYTFGVTLALITFVSMAISLVCFVIDLGYFAYSKKGKVGEIFGSSLIVKLLMFNNFVGGLIGLVSAGKSIYGFDCTVFQTCGELYRTLFTVYFWLIMGSGCFIVSLLCCSCCCACCAAMVVYARKGELKMPNKW